MPFINRHHPNVTLTTLIQLSNGSMVLGMSTPPKMMWRKCQYSGDHTKNVIGLFIF